MNDYVRVDSFSSFFMRTELDESKRESFFAFQTETVDCTEFLKLFSKVVLCKLNQQELLQRCLG